jgi:hypothetical protein
VKYLFTKKLLFLLGCGLFMFSLNACGVNRGGIQVGGRGPAVKHGPPPHAPAHGYRAKYAYRYYPACHVYFDVHRQVYFYLAGGNWRMSVSLPSNIRMRLADHVIIEMDSDRPYIKFSEHKRKYPPGQMKKNKKWVKKK